MRLPEYIIKMLRKKSGNDLYLPSDCDFLSLDIESNLGVHIGATTLTCFIHHHSFLSPSQHF